MSNRQSSQEWHASTLWIPQIYCMSFLSFTLYFFFRKVKVTKLKEVIDANVNCYDDGQDSAASDVITVTFYPGCLILFQACNVNLLLNKDWIQDITWAFCQLIKFCPFLSDPCAQYMRIRIYKKNWYRKSLWEKFICSMYQTIFHLMRVAPSGGQISN